MDQRAIQLMKATFHSSWTLWKEVLRKRSDHSGKSAPEANHTLKVREADQKNGRRRKKMRQVL